MKRRRFLLQSTSRFAAGTFVAASARLMAEVNPEPQRVVVGLMGLNRGKDLAANLLKIPGVEIKYACDADSKRAAAGAKFISELGN